MASIGSGGFVRRTGGIVLALVATLAFAAPALAKHGGNAGASAACEDGGYLEWTDGDGNAFRNAGACVSYAAHGGTLVPVVVEPENPFAISYAQSGPGAFVATLTGAGLEPGSTVDLFFVWGENPPRFLGDEADVNGEIIFMASGVCVSGGFALTAVGAVGTLAGADESAEYELPLPSICP